MENNIVKKDENGNVIFEQHPDGFIEESKYVDNKLVKQITKYPNGITEIDHYALPKGD